MLCILAFINSIYPTATQALLKLPAIIIDCCMWMSVIIIQAEADTMSKMTLTNSWCRPFAIGLNWLKHKVITHIPPLLSWKTNSLALLMPDHTKVPVRFQPWNGWGLCWEIDVGQPLFTLLQLEMPTDDVWIGRCDQPLSSKPLHCGVGFLRAQCRSTPWLCYVGSGVGQA